MKLMVAIPAYNEALVIARVLRSLKAELKNISGFDQKNIIVVNDGSTDQTGQISQKHADIVFNHLLNLGLGGALATAFTYARKNTYDILVTFDADGQHQAKDIPRLIKPIIKGEADVVIGSRMLGLGNMPFLRKFINKTANIITRITGGVTTSDSQSGLRVFNHKAIHLIRLHTRGMEVSSEILHQIKVKKLRFLEIPIAAIYTNYSQDKGQPITDAPKVFFRFLFRIIR